MIEKRLTGKYCNRCGECCREPYIPWVRYSDMRRWEHENRDDILSHVKTDKLKGLRWLDMNDYGECTFLDHDSEGFACSIEGTKPYSCGIFPVSDDLEITSAPQGCSVMKEMPRGYVIWVALKFRMRRMLIRMGL